MHIARDERHTSARDVETASIQIDCVAMDGAARQGTRAIISASDVEAASVIISCVAMDRAARHGQRAPCHEGASARSGSCVAMDGAARQNKRAAACNVDATSITIVSYVAMDVTARHGYGGVAHEDATAIDRGVVLDVAIRQSSNSAGTCNV